uniref:Protein kinase domain-containing protein n=1 Tax=Leersia perrieri TaxID=77586 RepID=A0A0D9VY22_9ORYZ
MAARHLLLLAIVGSLISLCASEVVDASADADDGGDQMMRPLKMSCSTGASNYTAGSQYHKNLDQLLAAIPMAAADNRGFSNTTFGTAPDEVFGLVMCYAEVNQDADQCRMCLAGAPARIMQLCPGSRTARAVFDACVVLYSDASFFSVAGDLTATSFHVQAYRPRPPRARGGWTTTYREFSLSEPPFVVDAAAMNRTRSDLITSLTVTAARAPLRLASDHTPFGGTPSMLARSMRGFVQCRRDLPASECTRCLSSYSARLPQLLPNNSGGAIKGYSCLLTYNIYSPEVPWLKLPSDWEFREALEEEARVKRKRHRRIVAAVAGSVCAVVLVICLSLLARYFLHRWKLWRAAAAAKKSEVEQPVEELNKGATGPRRFSYGELSAATGDFSGDNKLGEGGFGSVYRGVLTNMNDLPVAVKKVSKSSRQGWKEFVSEISIISRLRHRNLVQLIGWCHDGNGGGGGELLLVYQLMPNGSLDSHIYGGSTEENAVVLPWPARYDVVLGVGAALVYLHEETTEQCVLHRDIKPSNVMLDATFNAKLGDFGLARLVVGDGRRSCTTGAAGTLGYMDPECVSAFTASVESDVYSFGVLLLEIACGRRPAVPTGDGGGGVVHLAQWVWEWHGRGAILEAADARLEGEFDGQEMERVLGVGLWCAHPDRALRPSMRQAVGVLRCEAPLPDLPARMPVATYTAPPASAGSTGSGGDICSSCSITIET